MQTPPTARTGLTARAVWAAGDWSDAKSLAAAYEAVCADDATTARWLAVRAAGQAESGVERQLAQALIGKLASTAAGCPPVAAEPPCLPAGRVVLEGRTVVGEVVCAETHCSIELEVDGRFSRFGLAPAPVSASAAHPRRFRLQLPEGVRLVRLAHQARQLAGSPLVLAHEPEPCPARGAADGVTAWVMVPVHGAAHAVQRCIQSLLAAHNMIACRILVVDDATPDPALAAWLRERAADGEVTLLQRSVNGGFVAAVNTGLRYLGARDVVLLNSDTVVTDGWLDRLSAAAHSAPDVGAANPLSNNAELLSIPQAMAAGAMPGVDLQQRINRWLAARHAGQVVDLPAGVGFCWYLRGDALAAVGLLDESLIDAGYGEDTEFSIRLQRAGRRVVAALDVYVAHEGTRSFGAAKRGLVARNVALTDRRFPDHEPAYLRFLDADPLGGLARELQRALVTGGAAAGQSMLLTDAVCWARRLQFRTAPAWALLPQWSGGRLAAVRLAAHGVAGVGHVDYAWPGEESQLLGDLAAARLATLSRETFADWTPALIAALAGAGIPQTARLVDASAYCPRRHASHQPRERCGEPAADADCAACIAAAGATQRGVGRLSDWRAAVALSLAQASGIDASAHDLARRLQARLARPVQCRARGEAPPATQEVAATRIAFIGLGDLGAGFALVSDLARAIDRAGDGTRLLVIGGTFDDRRLARYGCVELPGAVEADRLEAALKALDCDALADPAFSSDGYVAELADRAALPVLSRQRLVGLLASFEAAA